MKQSVALQQVVDAIEEETGRRCIVRHYESGEVEFELAEPLQNEDGTWVIPATVH